jgi:preprotein translocase SecE subunit
VNRGGELDPPDALETRDALADDADAAPDPIAHASPDAELAAAQLALGAAATGAAEDEIPDEDELDELATRPTAAGRAAPGGNGAELAAPAGTAVERRPSAGHRLITFLQGSWAELQRVQWPDRRQVMQATGVVIGFVIVAGVFLGVSDTVAAHLMDWILK